MLTTEEHVRSFCETFERWAQAPADAPAGWQDSLKMASAYMVSGIRANNNGIQTPEMLAALAQTTLAAEAPWVRTRCQELLAVLARDTPGYAAKTARETFNAAARDPDTDVAASARRHLGELAQSAARRQPSL
jgi:hypothetical protein